MVIVSDGIVSVDSSERCYSLCQLRECLELQ